MPIANWLVFFLSGIAGLGHQVVWTKVFAAGLGHEAVALLGVAAAFLGGMAIGAYMLRIRESVRPERWYAALETVIGVWTVAAVWMAPRIQRVAAELLGPEPSAAGHWCVALALPFLILLPATACMGATLPAMERWVASMLPQRSVVGSLYAVNTLGGVAGTLMSGFVLMPTLGLRAALVALAALNLICAAACLVLGASQVRKRETPAAAIGAWEEMRWNRRAAALFAMGLLGVGYELVGVQVLSQVLENTVYSFAAVLAVYLAGTSLGAAAWVRLRTRACRHKWSLGELCLAIGASGVAGMWTMSKTRVVYEVCRGVMGDSLWAVMGAEVAASAAVFGLPAFFMGAAFVQLVSGIEAPGAFLGRALGWNLFGAALAGIIFSAGLVPWVGSKWALTVVCLGYLALARWTARNWNLSRWACVVACVVLIAGAPSRLHTSEELAGGSVLEVREGVMATAAVVQTPDGHRSLRVNHRFQMGGTGVAQPQKRQAYIPLLLHGDPRRALFLGTGTGITFGAARVFPGLEADGVELLPEVAALMRYFNEYSGLGQFDPRLRLHRADARRYVRTRNPGGDATYDMIVADLFHPAQDGAGMLYTSEHFTAIRGRLAPGGLFCQWLPLHQMDESTLQLVIRTFLHAFPDTRGYLLHFNVDIPVLGLAGTLAPRRYAAGWVEKWQSTGGQPIKDALREAGLSDTLRLLGCLVGGPEQLKVYAGEGPLNTDNFPRVTFEAPRAAVRRKQTPHALLISLLGRCKPTAEEVLADSEPPGTTGQYAKQLNAYLIARDIYLNGLVAEAEGRMPQAIGAYLESTRTSLHFTPAYARCVNIILVMVKTNREEARRLYDRLLAAQPDQPLGEQMLGPYFR